jgi:hypothetical protein
MEYAAIKNPRSHRLLCSITGAPADHAHHVNQKGTGGRGSKAPDNADDATPLCKRAHDAIHSAGELKLTRSDCGTLYYTASGKTARWLHAKEGFQYVAAYEGKTYDDPMDAPIPSEETGSEQETLGTALRTLETRIAASVSGSGEESRIVAEAAYASRDLFAIEPGGKEGIAAWHEWCEQLTTADGSPIPLSKSTLSKMGTVLRHLPEDRARRVPFARQYEAARAIKAGLVTREEGATMAETLSESAMKRELYGDKEEAAPVTFVCLHCGATGSKSELIEEAS